MCKLANVECLEIHCPWFSLKERLGQDSDNLHSALGVDVLEILKEAGIILQEVVFEVLHLQLAYSVEGSRETNDIAIRGAESEPLVFGKRSGESLPRQDWDKTKNGQLISCTYDLIKSLLQSAGENLRTVTLSRLWFWNSALFTDLVRAPHLKSLSCEDIIVNLSPALLLVETRTRKAQRGAKPLKVSLARIRLRGWSGEFNGEE